MDTFWNMLPKDHGHGRWFTASRRRVANQALSAVYPGADHAPGITDSSEDLSAFPAPAGSPTSLGLQGKRVAMVTFSPYPFDPRPRRAADALIKEGMSVDLFCVGDKDVPKREFLNGINIWRLPVTNRRGGKFAYAYQYSAFILLSSVMMGLRSLRHRYDMVYVHNMPDVLVVSALIPKMLGAKVILDLHDPMPELMTTIFNLDPSSLSVRLIARLEKWSMARADQVLTVNVACKRIFASRSCSPAKIGVVMNSPHDEIFPFQTVRKGVSRIQTPNKRFVIMYHGSIVERNGLDLAIDALALVRQTVPTAELRIYGSKTPFSERMMDEVHNKGLNESVRYLGRKTLEELVREIDDCDVGIIPNPRNAFTEINTPTRIFEYLAMGKPVIAPRTLGIQDYFNPQSLFFFEPGDAEELAQKIEYVSSHAEETNEVVERGQQVYLAHTWSTQRRTLVSLVSEVLNGGHTA
jgi:glycosyltransferase involved in cell wall biosynthesis